MLMFLDTEFTGLHQHTTLISLALVTEEDKIFYAEFTDYDKSQIDDWLEENIIKNLQLTLRNNSKSIIDGNCLVKGDKDYILKSLLEWLPKEEIIKIWSDCLSYDWVLLNELWGGAFNKPENVYYIPFDICTLFEVCGIDPDINREEFVSNVINKVSSISKHNALHDAIIIKKCYNKLVTDLLVKGISF